MGRGSFQIAAFLSLGVPALQSKAWLAKYAFQADDKPALSSSDMTSLFFQQNT